MKYEFITQANAQEAVPSAAPNDFSFASFVPLILIFVVFYFLIIRPQSKKMKEHQAMLAALKVGDKVVTGGGIIGTVEAIDSKENILEIEIADNVSIKVLRAFVTDLVKKEEDKKNNKK
jgi:preprotein translocase subunit YajC